MFNSLIVDMLSRVLNLSPTHAIPFYSVLVQDEIDAARHSAQQLTESEAAKSAAEESVRELRRGMAEHAAENARAAAALEEERARHAAEKSKMETEMAALTQMAEELLARAEETTA